MKEQIIITIDAEGADSGTVAEAIYALWQTREAREISHVEVRGIDIYENPYVCDVTYYLPILKPEATTSDYSPVTPLKKLRNQVKAMAEDATPYQSTFREIADALTRCIVEETETA